MIGSVDDKECPEIGSKRLGRGHPRANKLEMKKGNKREKHRRCPRPHHITEKPQLE